MPVLQFYFLGALDVCFGGQPLPKPPTLKSQSLLAYLVHHRHQPQPRERLAGMFWGDRPAPKARHSLATALWHIRRSLSPTEPGLSRADGYVLSDSHTLQFDPQADLWLDVDQFESEIARQHVAGLEAAVALYRGDFLEGFYDDWIINERYRLETLFSDALARLMAEQETRGEHRAALSTSLRLLRHDPLREDAHRLAMRAYCRLGKRNAALKQYHRYRGLVQAELGAEPMIETTNLYRAILEGHFSVRQVRVFRPFEAEPAIPLGRSPLDAIAPSRLVGREHELDFLRECWQRAKGGRGGLVCVRGEAGVGKTRLVEEFARQMRWQGFCVLLGRCYEFERLLPYQPISEALRMLTPTLTPAGLAGLPAWALAELIRLVPELVERIPPQEEVDPAESTRDQTRLFEAVTRFLGHLSSAQPMLITIEDLPWASESTLQMLHYLTRRLAGHPILLLGTLREEAVGRRHPLRALQRQLDREDLACSLHLPRLSPEAVETMLVEMSGAGDSVVPLAERLYRETEGNPFLLTEVIKALFEAEQICLERGAWRGDFAQISQGDLPLPTSVSEAILARVDSLSVDAKEVLRLAAVLGREFDFDLLNEVWGRGQEATLEVLDILLRRRLLEEGSGTMGRDYAFTHHKIREVIYARMPRQRLQHSHARVGAAMESLRVPEEASAGELAYHFEQGRQLDDGLGEKAIAYLLQAGDQARRLYAHHEAIGYYQQGLMLLKERGAHERAARTLMRLGLTYHNAFDFRQSRKAYDEGFALWQQVGDLQPTTLPPAPHALRVNWADPTTLDPALADNVASHAVIDQLFSGLVELSPEMEVLPDIARTWEVLDGGRRYIFRLRDDVVWSDGAPLTAFDFEYAWKRAIEPATGSTVADMLYDVKGASAFHHGEASDPDGVGVQALDRGTLAVELEGPTGYFLYLMANHVTWPVPRHAVEAHGEAWTAVGNIVTNGPFRLADCQPGEFILLSRYPGYHGRFGGNVQQVELRLIPRTATLAALELYEAGELDILNLGRLPHREIDSIRQGHLGEYVRVPTLSTDYLGFDMRRAPFDDLRVRLAFVLAVERETLAEVVLGGYALPATGGLVPQGMPGHSPRIGLPYDPDRARRLLAKAGFPGGHSFPVVEAVAMHGHLQHTRHLNAQWRETLGVETSWDLVDMVTWDRPPGEPPHLFVLGWLADYPDPDSFLRTSTIPYCIGWQNETCQRLVETARRVTDQPHRMKLYGQAERILLEEARIMPLTHTPNHLLVKPWVSRYRTSVMGTYSWKDVIIEPH